MAKVRGTAILGTLAFARGRFGEQKTRELVDGLTGEQKALLRDFEGSGIAMHGWYDTALLADLTGRLDSRLGSGDLSTAREVGQHVAFQDVNRFFKWLMRLGGPEMVLSRAGAVWNNYYDDGRYVLESVGDGRGVLRIEGSSSAGPIICKRIEGWMERALVLTLPAGAEPVIREEAHLVREPAVGPQSFCRFVAEWKR